MWYLLHLYALLTQFFLNNSLGNKPEYSSFFIPTRDAIVQDYKKAVYNKQWLFSFFA